MKKSYLTLFLTSCFLLFGWSQLQAQCDPDTTITSSGIYPATIPEACANLPYATVLTVNIPLDTMVSFPPFGTFSIPIDSLVVDSVSGIPSGITFDCNPSSCVFLGGTSNCILISGTASVADTFTVTVSTTTWVTVIGNVLNLPTTVSYDFIVRPGMTNTVSVTDASCGVNDGIATVNSTGAGPFTYLWSNGDTTATSDNLAAGTYTVAVVDTNGCQEDIQVVVGQTGNPPALSLDGTSWAGCNGAESGDIAVSIVGGTPPLAYSWSNGDTTEDISGLAGGTYTLTVTDSAGCIATETYTVNEPAALVLSAGPINQIDCAGNDNGEITVVASGGLAPYTYSWLTSPSQNTSTISGLAPGDYGLIVTDSLGCVEDISVEIVEPEALNWTLSSTNETSYEKEDGTAEIVVEGGTGAYTYSWSNGETTAAIDSLPPGVYTISVTDENNCSFIDSVEVVAVNVSIEDELSMGISEFVLFPNPNSGDELTIRLNLQTSQLTELRILSGQGKMVRSFSPGLTQQWQEKVSLQGLAAGIYLVQLRTERGTASRKLLVR
jgi:hypothetical protein